LLEYDDVANDQRKVIYTQRNELLEARDMSEISQSLRHGVFTELFQQHVPPESMEEQWDLAGLDAQLANEWQLNLSFTQLLIDEPTLTEEELLHRLLDAADAVHNAKVELVTQEAFGGFERNVMLQSMDSHWREHLAALDHLRQGIHLRGYAQKNPKQEYKREAFELFSNMLDLIRNDVVRTVMTVRVQSQEEIIAAEEDLARSHLENINYQHADFNPNLAPEELLSLPPADQRANAPQVNDLPKVGRNDPCPCGSGKKFKQCHGKLG
jgi:preprotein translocase subunit SecA